MTKVPERIEQIFSSDIHRKIGEVIKVDELTELAVADEIREYWPTESIQSQLRGVLEAYDAVRRGPTDNVGVWVSGFFGAGKSSFAKLLGLLLRTQSIGGVDPSKLFAERITNPEIKVLLVQIREHIRTHVVMFDILKDQTGTAHQHPVSLVAYRWLLHSLGYPRDPELAELEITLERRARLEEFKTKYAELYDGRTWDEGKGDLAFALFEASNTLHHLDKETYPAPDTYANHPVRVDVTPRLVAERALQLSQVRKPGHNVVFVIDEIGQYTATDLNRVLDLNGLIECFSMSGKGKLWLIATAQEKLDAVVDVWKVTRPQLARLQDRFAHKVFLEPSDIREVASHRILAKTAPAEEALRGLLKPCQSRLGHNTKLAAAIGLPGVEEDPFVRLYPLLPYQIDLLMLIVSGLRSAGAAAQTMGGATRTIIKLAQQLIVDPIVGISIQPLGTLVTLDSVYELLSTSVPSEYHQEIDEIERQLGSFEARVTKALALLQFAEAVATHEENLAAVLHPSIDAPSLLPGVREAVERLLAARKIRRTEHGGLKVQSAAERTWDQDRDSRTPSPGERMRILKKVLEEIWGKGASQPSRQLGGWRPFRAGLRVGTETIVDGEVVFEVRLVDELSTEASHAARGATQGEQRLVCWVADVSGDAERAVIERFRSEQMISRGPRTKEEDGPFRDEQHRLREASRRLRDQLERGLCRGKIFFRGTEYSPGAGAASPKQEAERVLSPALDAIFYRFEDGGIRVHARDVEAVLQSVSLVGLPSCYGELGVVRTVDGNVRIIADEGAAKEILDWVRDRCDDGNAPSGKELQHHFGGPPYGWSLELVQLIVGVLLRAEQISLLSGSDQIKQAVTPEALRAIPNNTRFRSLTVRSRKGPDPKLLRRAAMALEERFGHKCDDLTAASIARALREKLCPEISRVDSARVLLRDLRLPGEETLAQGLDSLRALEGRDDEDSIQVFLDSADTLAKALPRARTIEERLTDSSQADLSRAQTCLNQVGPVLVAELNEEDPAVEELGKLRDDLAKETFYDRLAAIRNSASAVINRFGELYSTAFASRRGAYADCLEKLYASEGWAQLASEDQDRIAGLMRERANAEPIPEPWRLAASILEILREETRSAPAILAEALSEVRRIRRPEAIEIAVRTLISGAIESPEQLEAALNAIRVAVEKALAENKPVVLV